MAVILAAIGAVLVALGGAIVHPALGLMLAGAECVAAAYLVQYFKARSANEDSRASR
jgi:hypothetical protein